MYVEATGQVYCLWFRGSISVISSAPKQLGVWTEGARQVMQLVRGVKLLRWDESCNRIMVQIEQETGCGENVRCNVSWSSEQCVFPFHLSLILYGSDHMQLCNLKVPCTRGYHVLNHFKGSYPNLFLFPFSFTFYFTFYYLLIWL